MLDQNTLQDLKNKLTAGKEKLEKDLGQIAQRNGDDYEATFEDFGRDQEDNAEEIATYAANVGVTESLEKELRDINDALERMENGTYGVCENCKEEIPLERLMAYPAARECVKCLGAK